jgi:hypothetical protein
MPSKFFKVFTQEYLSITLLYHGQAWNWREIFVFQVWWQEVASLYS